MYCAVFDLDGTLADTSGDLLAAANAQFAAMGLTQPLVGSDRLVALRGGRAMLRLGASRLGIAQIDEFADAHYEPFLAHYAANIDMNTALYDGVLEALDQLENAGWVLAVCTNKPIDLALDLLKKLQIKQRFASIIGVGSIKERKPDPAPLFLAIKEAGSTPSKSILIGDSETDFHTALNAQIPIVLVDFDDSNIAERFQDAPLVRSFSNIPHQLEEIRKLQLDLDASAQ